MAFKVEAEVKNKPVFKPLTIVVTINIDSEGDFKELKDEIRKADLNNYSIQDNDGNDLDYIITIINEIADKLD